MRLKNVLLVVRDIAQSKRFYHELFGLQIVRDFGDNVILSEGLALQEQTNWEQLIHTPTVTGNTSELFFEENNLDAFLLSAREYGVEFVGDVRLNSWDKRVVMLKDPDGHLIEVAENK